MKCNACYERLEPTQISRGRCPYCGAAIMAKKEKLPIGFWLCAVPFLLIGPYFSSLDWTVCCPMKTERRIMCS